MLLRIVAFTMLLAALTFPVWGQAGDDPDNDSSTSAKATTSIAPRENAMVVVRVSSITGVVRTAEGQRAGNVRVGLRDRRTGRILATAFTGESGAYVFRDVERGAYEVIAYQGSSEARQFVEMSFGDMDVNLRLPALSSGASGAAAASEPYVSVARLKAPEKAMNELRKAQRLAKSGTLPEARAAALKALEIFPDYAEALTFLGMLDLQERKPGQATQELERAIHLDPSSALAHAALGSTYNALGQYDNAMRVLEDAVRLEPKSWQFQFELARAYLGKDDYANSLQHSDLGLALAGDSFSLLHLVCARALMGMENYGRAIVELETFLRQQPEGPEAAVARRELAQAKAWSGQERK